MFKISVAPETAGDVELGDIESPKDPAMSTEEAPTKERSSSSRGIPMKETEPELDFTPSKGLTSAEAAKLLEQWGMNELPEKVTPKVCVLLSPSLFSLLV